MRYRSAPSSYFNEMLDRELCQQFFNRPSSPETERIFARFMTSTDDLDPLKPPVTIPTPTPNPNLTPNPEPVQSSNNNYSAPPPPPATFYQSASKPPLPTSQAMNSGGEVPYSQRMNTQIPAMKTGLVRHSSSPAGLFANIDIDSVIGELTGFGATRGGGMVGTYGGNSINNNTSTVNDLEASSFSPASRLKRTSSTGPMMTEDKNDNNYAPNFPWDDMSDNISGLKRLRGDEDDYDDDVKPFSGMNPMENQKPPMLSHHLSLPKTPTEMAAIEKFLQFQDSVPCKIRAKRGCATHPRSIAERVRRTRISERMRKLQELVPNMEKQTNTADMLDLAVEYIKDLQSQVQTLDDSRAKCTCSIEQQKEQ